MKIVTHPGDAHFDDFMACCYLISMLPIKSIARRDPTEQDFEDLDTYVIDVGQRHEPEKHNFDHHNVPGTEGKCALDLVLEYFKVRDIVAEASDWLSVKSSLDCFGPYTTANTIGISADVLHQLESPIEHQLLRLFAGYDNISDHGEMYSLMLTIGANLNNYWLSFADQMTRAKEQAKIVNVRGLQFVDFRDCVDVSFGVQNKYMKRLNAAGSIMQDNRGPGCENRVILYRFADNPRVNFSRLDPSEMHFVHHNGFIAKTRDYDTAPERIYELLLQATSCEPVIGLRAV